LVAARRFGSNRRTVTDGFESICGQDGSDAVRSFL
jgi:hypothetical protein